MVKIKLKFWDNLFIILLLLLFSPLFFFKLSQSSLVSFDEAWYGDIARNILNSGDPINLIWNGSSYIDHPPAGFWFLAISELIFGVNEFGVRFAPAFLGLLSLVIVYFLGVALFKSKVVGFASALAFSSSFWFLFRARSGNLDVILTFFFLLTFYLAIKAVKEKKFLLPWSASLSLLFLTKTLVPATLIPSLIIIFWKTKYSLKEFLWPAVLFFLIVGGWLVNQIIIIPNFLSHYLGIGLPGIDANTDILANFLLVKEYLHSGIGKWFWPGILGIFAGVFFIQKRFFILSAFFFSFLAPAVFSHKVHIWHLIPLYPFMILAFFGFAFVLLEKLKVKSIIITIILLGISIYFSGMQIRQAWFQFIDLPAFVSDEAILSKEASKYPNSFYIDGDFQQAAIFYSGKVVKKLSHDEILAKFAGDEKFLLITKQDGLELVKEYKDKYEILKTDRDKFLILKENPFKKIKKNL